MYICNSNVSCVTSVHVNWGHQGHPCFHSSVWIVTHHLLLLLIVGGIQPAMPKRTGAGEYWCMWEVEHGVNIAHVIIYCVVTPLILFNCEYFSSLRLIKSWVMHSNMCDVSDCVLTPWQSFEYESEWPWCNQCYSRKTIYSCVFSTHLSHIKMNVFIL